jgi:hypothetical protein
MNAVGHALSGFAAPVHCCTRVMQQQQQQLPVLCWDRWHASVVYMFGGVSLSVACLCAPSWHLMAHWRGRSLPSVVAAIARTWDALLALTPCSGTLAADCAAVAFIAAVAALAALLPCFLALQPPWLGQQAMGCSCCCC